MTKKFNQSFTTLKEREIEEIEIRLTGKKHGKKISATDYTAPVDDWYTQRTRNTLTRSRTSFLSYRNSDDQKNINEGKCQKHLQ